MLEVDDDDGLVAIDIVHNIVSVEGVSDSMDLPLSFDTMSGFVTRFDDIFDGNNDTSIFEYFPVTQHFPLITPPATTTHIYDVDDVGDIDDPLGGLSRPPDPGPTRWADPNRSPGRDTIYTIYILCCTGTLIDLFFLRAVSVPVSIQTISVITKIIYIYQKNYHRSSVHKNLYTHTESLFLHMYNFYTKPQRLRKQRWCTYL